MASVRSAASTTATKQTQLVPLARRLLFPALPASTASLPPLLASSGLPAELDIELYDFTALALRAFVVPWWSKISRYDKDFLPSITSVLTSVIRSLESRVLAADLTPLLLQTLPLLLTQHYSDFRNAQAKVASAYASGGAASLPQLFHQLQPHIAVDANGVIDDVYVRTAVDHILKACLPEEDYAPEAERFIVREIVLKVVLQDVVPRVTQPWFIHRTILNLLGPSKEVKEKPPSPPNATPFSFHTVIIFFLSAIQSISGAFLALAHAYKHARSTIELANHSPHTQPAPPSLPTDPGPPAASTAAEATPPGSLLSPPISRSSSASSSRSTATPPSSRDHDHDYARAPLELAATILTLSDRFASNALYSTASVLAAAFSPFLDRLLPYLVHTHVLSPRALLIGVGAAKGALFPLNGYPAPSPPDPDMKEQAELRAALERRLLELIPGYASPAILGPEPTRTIDAALQPLGSAACNAHLVVLVLDAFLLALFPELGVDGGGDAKGPSYH
ncbi:hypothetical protein PLICRDRAFT_49505 [Plicaturopsis crispa FD-325 SS-3]|nr:hypothetical protein PLICRDRAFT_49505 [Plicaturopsis crispa FD-325 SS-3]